MEVLKVDQSKCRSHWFVDGFDGTFRNIPERMKSAPSLSIRLADRAVLGSVFLHAGPVRRTGTGRPAPQAPQVGPRVATSGSTKSSTTARLGCAPGSRRGLAAGPCGVEGAARRLGGFRRCLLIPTYRLNVVENGQARMFGQW